jgi:hypothetical protein
MNDLVKLIITLIGIACIVAGALFGGWLKLLKESNKLLREQNADLKAAYQLLSDKFAETTAEAACLKGQVNVLETLPLKRIDASLHSLASQLKNIVELNKKIVTILADSSTITAGDAHAAMLAAEEVKQTLAEHTI